MFHRRRRILKKNFSRYEDGYKYIVVELHKKRAIKAFRTLKEAKIYLNDIGEYYRAKNYNVFMNSYSRSLSISSVAQYIGTDASSFLRVFGRRKRYVVMRYRTAFSSFPYMSFKQVQKFDKSLEWSKNLVYNRGIK